ncbi:MAG: flagellar biosynthetic protein FliR [Candidatus Electryonea clarkiae]|nr:flagellar biosynthetic protein FliR [Candidatus Electryonea clarkiae]MDP8287157.1 flagellar biosynthetic protein FliR [Candidatus Electryonea clarkiae]
MDVLSYNLDEIERWLLMLFRISSMLMVFPFYGLMGFPMVIRAAVAVLLTTILFPIHTTVVLDLEPGIISYFGAIVKEIIIGAAIGMVGTFIFIGIQFAGQILGHIMGFSMVNVIDPQSETSVPLLAQLLNYLALIIFLILGGHHFLLLAIDECFLRIPVGGGIFDPLMVEGIARLSADIFIVGVKIGSPVLVAILVTDFALGIMARTVPQMNVWIIGFPLKIGIGLLTLSLTLPFFVYVFGKLYQDWQGNIIDFIHVMAG